MLAKSSDARLKQLAQQDLAKPADSTAQKSLADEWYDYAQSLPAQSRARAHQRAGDWYVKAYPGSTGLPRFAITKRLEELGRRPELPAIPVAKAELSPVTAVAPAPAATPAGEWIDLLKNVDLKRDVITGSWQQDGAALVSNRGGRSGLAWKVPITGALDVHAVFARLENNQSISFFFPVGDTRGQFALSVEFETLSGVHIRGFPFSNSPASVRPGKLENGREYTLDLHVIPQAGDEVSISAELDGKPYFTWKGSKSLLNYLPENWPIPADRSIALGTFDSSFRVKEFKVRQAATNPAATPATQAVTAEWVDLLKTADPAKNAIKGDWRLETPSKLTINTSDLHQRITFDSEGIRLYQEAYDIQVRFTRHTGEGDVNFIFPAGKTRALFGLSIGSGKASGLCLKNFGFTDTPAGIRPGKLENNREYTLDLRVMPQGEDVSISVSLDGKAYFSWTGPQASLRMHENWPIPDGRRFALGTYASTATFTAFRVRPAAPTALAPVPAFASVSWTAPDQPAGITWVRNGDSQYTQESIAGKDAVRTNRYLYFNVDDAFAFDLPRSEDVRTFVRLQFYGEKKTWVKVAYDGYETPDNNSPWRTVRNRARIDENKQWTERVQELIEPKLAGRLHLRSDIRLDPETAEGIPPLAGISVERIKLLPLSERTVGPGQVVDLLALVDPQYDGIPSPTWRREGNSIVSRFDTSALVLPVTVQGAYRLDVQFTRLDGKNLVQFVLPTGSTRVAVQLDAWAAVSGLALVDGQVLTPDSRNPTLVRGPQLTDGRPASISITVVPRGENVSIKAVLDGRTLIDWNGPAKLLKADFARRPSEIHIGPYNSSIRVDAATLQVLEGSAVLLKRDTSPQAAASQPAVIQPGAAPRPAGASDLLAAVDLTRDVLKGNWTRRPDGFRCDFGDVQKLRLPATCRGAYNLQVQFTRHQGIDTPSVNFPVGDTDIEFGFSIYGGRMAGLANIDGVFPTKQDPSLLVQPAHLENGHRYTADFHIRPKGDQAEITVELDGKPYFRWSGPQKSLAANRGGRERVFGFLAWKSEVTLHSYSVRTLDGELQWLNK